MARIVHAIDYRSPVAGSFIPAVAALSRALRARGHESIVAAPRVAQTPPWHEALLQSGASIHETDRYADLYALFARLRPQLVHVHFSGYAVASAIGAMLHGVSNLYWHVHSSPGEASIPLRSRLLRTAKFAGLARRVSRIFAVTPEIAMELERFGAPRRKLAVIENGIAVERFVVPSTPERRAARHGFGLAADERVALFFGRDAAIKGTAVLRAALAGATRPPTVLFVGPAGDAEGLEPFTRVVRCEGLDDVRPALWAGDSIVMPSSTEGLPLTLLEARACGLPALVSEIPPLARYAGRDRGATAIERGDIARWARSLDAIDSGARVPLSQELRAAISLDRWVDEVLKSYDL
ncbi:MAG TPA: glycosyltransferase family 4 protein [Candidatus Baltobacteraceae bacterium]